MPESEDCKETPEALPTQSSSSDHSLLERFRQGEQEAATQLYVRYAARLRGLIQARLSANLARRVEADDIVQSVFRTFFRRAGEGHYDVPVGEELWKLFIVIGLNKVRTQSAFHTAAKRDVRNVVEGGYDGSLEQLSNEDSAAEVFLRLVVEETLANLPEHHRRIVQLRMEGYDVAEIAERIQRSKRTTERILQDIRTGLGKLLEQEKTE